MKVIFKFVLGFIIITIVVSTFLLLKNKEEKTQMRCVIQPFCATESNTANDPDIQKGKQIFNANCAACHKLDAVSTGPALRGVAEKYHQQNGKLYNYLQGKRDAHLLRSLGEEPNGLCTIFPNLTKEDVASLEAYTH